MARSEDLALRFAPSIDFNLFLMELRMPKPYKPTTGDKNETKMPRDAGAERDSDVDMRNEPDGEYNSGAKNKWQASGCDSHTHHKD